MECVILSGRCRACSIKTQKEFQIPIFATENLQLIFHEATSLEIHENDGLPEAICEDCHKRLLEAHEFRQMCAASALEFQQIISGDGDSDFEEKYKPPEVSLNSAEESPRTNISYPDDKFIPLEGLVETRLDGSTQKMGNLQKNAKETVKNATRKNKRSSRSQDPLNDDPEWTGKATKPRKQRKTTSEAFKAPRKQKCVPPDEGEASKEVKVKDEPEDFVSKNKTMRGRKAEYICSICGIKYIKRATLKDHMQTIHQGLKLAQCTVCQKEFTRPDNLRGHMVRMHGAKDMLKCEECGKVFRTEEGLTNHTKEWHDPENPKEKPKNYMCDLCGKAFGSPAALRKHTNSHAGIRPFKCTVCSRRYPTKHHFKIHMMRHEGIKNHVCTVCGLQKTTLTELKAHMNQHTHERIFACEQCPKTFLSMGNFSRHVRIVHQGIKAFDCPHCERSFGKKETLKHHVMTHTGEKPHACTVCGKRFIQPTALQTHMKTHQK